MRGRRHESASLQSDFFRLQFEKMMRWLIFSVIILLLLLATIFYLIFFEPPIDYYANTTDGNILNMPAQVK